jgi:hypothetical protein
MSGHEDVALRRSRWVGLAALFGGGLGLVLAPFMVAIKYMTGWAIVPEPFWVPTVTTWLVATFPGTTPAALWTGFGTGYSLALALTLVGVLGFGSWLRGRPRALRAGYWLLAAGLALVLPGDAIHSWTWHQNGLTVPTPGTNPVANTAYAAHMMGMNFVMVGSLVMGVAALRRRTLPPWLAWMLVLVVPAALFASLILLPTTPSGALWLFSLLVGVCGYLAARGHAASVQPA